MGEDTLKINREIVGIREYTAGEVITADTLVSVDADGLAVAYNPSSAAGSRLTGIAVAGAGNDAKVRVNARGPIVKIPVAGVTDAASAFAGRPVYCDDEAYRTEATLTAIGPETYNPIGQIVRYRGVAGSVSLCDVRLFDVYRKPGNQVGWFDGTLSSDDAQDTIYSLGVYTGPPAILLGISLVVTTEIPALTDFTVGLGVSVAGAAPASALATINVTPTSAGDVLHSDQPEADLVAVEPGSLLALYVLDLTTAGDTGAIRVSADFIPVVN